MCSQKGMIKLRSVPEYTLFMLFKAASEAPETIDTSVDISDMAASDRILTARPKVDRSLMLMDGKTVVSEEDWEEWLEYLNMVGSRQSSGANL
jgi:hypothetical protein